MDKNRCLILGAESVDSNSLNRCLANLYDLTDEKCSKTMSMTSVNIPSSPFFSGGFQNALTDIDYVSSITFDQGDGVATPITTATTAKYGAAPRTYGGSLQKCLTINDNFATETATGVYHYTEDDVATFVPTVNTLFTSDAPIAFTSAIDDDARTITTGTSALGCQSTPTVKFTSYMVCGYTGVSFGQITFKRKNSDVQNNVVTVNITRDLINRDDVDEVKFFSVSNGYASGVRRVSENLDLVSDINAPNLTYISDDDVIISNITKNDASDTIRIDKATGRILDKGEVRNYGEYAEIKNDTLSLNFFVVFSTRKDFVAFDEGSWCFYLCDDYDYARKSLTKADSYARGSINYKFLGFEAADDGYEDYLSDNPHKVHNAVKSSKDAFRGCFNATFPILSHFSSSYEYTDRMFKDCHHATFDSIPTCAYLPNLKTAVSMFDNCATATFSELEHIHYPRSSKLTKMFHKCSSALFSKLEDIDVNGSCGQMFYGDYSAEFKKLNSIRGGATVLDSMFEKCANSDFGSLSSISSTANGIVRAYSMFSGLSGNTFGSLESIDLGTVCYNANGMFRDCAGATFESLTSIGEPQLAEYQFYGCESASFGGLTSLGTHLSDGQHMFQKCKSLELVVEDDLNELDNATEMFEGAKSVTVCGDMDDLELADRMCANMEHAVLHGDMDKLVSARSAFFGTGTAFVYGSVDELADADSMFMNTGSARMAHVPSKLLNMLNMFTRSKSCCVYDYQPASAKVFEGSVQNRLSDSAFSYAGHVEITGNIFEGALESASNMFMNAGTTADPYNTDVLLVNPTMSGATDATNRYYYVGSNMEYTVIRDLDLTSGYTRLFSKKSIYDVKDKLIENAFGLGIQITDDETLYTLYLGTSGDNPSSYNIKPIKESDFDFQTSAYLINDDGDGNRYFISNAVNLTAEAWTVNQIVNGESEFKFNIESVGTATVESEKTTVIKYLEPSGEGVVEGTECTVYLKNAGGYFITIKCGTEELKIEGLLKGEYSITFNYVASDDGLDVVFTIHTGDNYNMYRMTHGGSGGSVTKFSDESKLLLKTESQRLTAKLYQIYKDEAKSDPFGFMMAVRETGSRDTLYYLFKGELSRTVDFTKEQGDIYSLDVALEGDSTNLTGLKVEFGVSINDVGITGPFIEADEMFRGVVSNSLLSGYDCVLSRNLTTTEGMFMLDERVRGDQTFKDTGRVFSIMDKTNIVDASGMFKNREVCDPYAFYAYGNVENRYYSFHIPTKLVDGESMFENCLIDGGGETEIGLYIPTTLVNARNMFNGFEGCLIRLGYNSNGAITLNRDIDYENMFNGAKFKNSESNNYTLTIPRVNMSVFRGSDFRFNSVDHIVEEDGRYFAPVNLSEGQRHELDNTEKIFETDAEGGAELGSFGDDITTWFDEGIYLATVLGPSGNEYRLQTEYLTGGRMRGHFQMADCSTKAAKNAFYSLADWTRNFKAPNMTELKGDRIASMFNPLVAVSFSEKTVGDRMVSLMPPSGFETVSDSVESTFGLCYQSALFNKVETISTREMPFAFAGLSSAAFANVRSVSGGIVNAAGAFMNCGSAKFSALQSIDVSDVPSIGVFESAYTDMDDTSLSGRYWNGNYIDMFANDTSATFHNLESILVKSRFFRLYPIYEALDDAWYDFTESSAEYTFGARNTYTLDVMGLDAGGKAVFSVATNGGESIVDFRTDHSVADERLKIHLVEDNDKNDPSVEVRLSVRDETAAGEFTETVRERWLVHVSGLVEALDESISPDPRYYNSNYLLTYFTGGAGGRGVLNFRAKTALRTSSHAVFIDESGDFLSIVFENNDTKQRTVFETDMPSSEEYSVEEEFGELNDTASDSELDYGLVVIVMITVGGVKRFFTARPYYGESEDDREFTIEESEFHPGANDDGKLRSGEYDLFETGEQTVSFGKMNYVFRFNTNSVGTFTFTVCDNNYVELATLDTGIASVATEEMPRFIVKFIETDLYNDESGETEDAVVVNFSNAGTAYVIYESGTIEETTSFPDIVRYRYHCKYYGNEDYLSENSSYCDGMFMNCGSARFTKLKTVSMAGLGSCAKMFAGCGLAEISDLEVFYLPVAYTDEMGDGGEHCYTGVFDGCDADKIDLSSLDAVTTNIHTLGYGTTPTRGRAFFSGMTSGGAAIKIESSDDALNYLGLSKDVGDLMDWDN